MRLLRDFACECGHVTERFIDSQVDEVQCSECGGMAKRVISFGTISLDGTNPDFPGAYDKWARVRIEERKQYDRKNK